MARADKTAEEKGKVKFRFVEFEMEGGSTSLEETIKTIAHSITRGSTPATGRLSVPNKAPAALPAGQNGDTTLDAVSEEVETEELETVSEARETPQRTQRGTRRYTTPKFLGDLDLDSDVSLNVFVNEHQPSSDNTRYLVISAWFKKHRNIDAIGIDHIHTCYQKMRWTGQKDVGQPFRYMMGKKNFYTSQAKGLFEITHIGLDEVTDIKAKAENGHK